MAPSSASDDAIISKLLALEFSLKPYFYVIFSTYMPPFLLTLAFAFCGIFKFLFAIVIILTSCFIAFYYSPKEYEDIVFFTFLFLLGEAVILMSPAANSLLLLVLGIILALLSAPPLIRLANTEEGQLFAALFLAQTSFSAILGLSILGYVGEATFLFLLTILLFMMITDTTNAFPVALMLYIYYAILFWPIYINRLLRSNPNRNFDARWYKYYLREKKVIAGTKYKLIERVKLESNFERWRAINTKTKEELFIDVPAHTLQQIDLFTIYEFHERAKIWNILASYLDSLLSIKDYSNKNRRLPFAVFSPVGEPISKIVTGRVNYYYVERIARKLVSTVSCLHKIGITNINLKPENIFVVGSEPKICGWHLNALNWPQIDISLERILGLRPLDSEILFVFSDRKLDLLQLCDVLELILIKPYINNPSMGAQAKKFLRNLLSAIEQFRKAMQWESVDEFPYLKNLDDSDRKSYKSIIRSLRRVIESDPYLNVLYCCAINDYASALNHISKIEEQWRLNDALKHLTLCFIRNKMILPALIAASIISYKKLRQYLLIIIIDSILKHKEFDVLVRFLNDYRIKLKTRIKVSELILSISKMRNIAIPKEFIESLEDPKIKKLYLKST